MQINYKNVIIKNEFVIYVYITYIIIWWPTNVSLI